MPKSVSMALSAQFSANISKTCIYFTIWYVGVYSPVTHSSASSLRCVLQHPCFSVPACSILLHKMCQTPPETQIKIFEKYSQRQALRHGLCSIIKQILPSKIKGHGLPSTGLAHQPRLSLDFVLLALSLSFQTYTRKSMDSS